MPKIGDCPLMAGCSIQDVVAVSIAPTPARNSTKTTSVAQECRRDFITAKKPPTLMLLKGVKHSFQSVLINRAAILKF